MGRKITKKIILSLSFTILTNIFHCLTCHNNTLHFYHFITSLSFYFAFNCYFVEFHVMESWSCVSEEKGYVSNHTLSPPNTLGRSKNSILGWELKTPCTFSNDLLLLAHPNIDNHQGFQDLGYPEMLGENLYDDLDGGHGARITGTILMAATPNPFSARGGCNFRIPNSNGTDSFIDLKLGRFVDHGEAIDAAFSKGAPIMSSYESSTPSKRVRASGLRSQTAYCQVYGCNKDLSSCKDYHKRHRVCEVHSKTAIVIVNGIEQRFCQQCSRFHLLAEFDDGKRSCRKRLAGHNERRRKPQMGINSGKAGRLLQPCGDSRFQGTMLTSASYICPDMLPSRAMPSEKYEMSDFWRPNKAEHGAGFRHLSSIPSSNGYSQSRSLFPSYNQKQFPFLHENGATSTTGSIFCDNNIQYPPVLGPQNSGSKSVYHQDTSLRSEDFNVFDTTSTVQGVSGISDSCALSLLSSQSQNSSSQSSEIPLSHSSVFPNSHIYHYNISQVSEKVGISSLTSSSHVSDRFPSEMNHVDGNHLNPVLIPDNETYIVNFEMADEIFQGSDFLNVKDRISSENGATIDLLQLSSQLQRVEHHRQSLQVKQENDSFCTLRIT